jgi:hypothetical protein
MGLFCTVIDLDLKFWQIPRKNWQYLKSFMVRYSWCYAVNYGRYSISFSFVFELPKISKLADKVPNVELFANDW